MTFTSEWRVVKFLIAPGGSPSSAGYGGATSSASAMCSYYGNSSYYYNGAETGCVDIASGNGTWDGTLGGTVANLHSGSYFSDDVPVGTKVCYAAGVYPASSYSTHETSQASMAANDAAMQIGTALPIWRYGEPACVTVGKKPKVEILGAGMNIPGMVSTSQTVKSFGGTGNALAMLTNLERRVYGSWSEYETVAGGAIKTSAGGLTGTATGAATGSYGLSTNGTYSRPEIKQWSRETITNSNDSALGNYVKAALPTIATRLSDDCGNIPNCTFSTASNIGGNSMSSGQTKVWSVSGNATISGNITYQEGPYGNINDLPQAVIIVRGNLIIGAGVTQIDAWVIVTGTIYTCNNISSVSSLNNSTCASKLVFNGPVSAGKIKLMRTAGSGVNNSLRTSCSQGINSCASSGKTVYGYNQWQDASGDPAEVFNLRADAYMWAFNQSLLGGQARTTYVREVAPRY
jgi:hypothetical protein